MPGWFLSNVECMSCAILYVVEIEKLCVRWLKQLLKEKGGERRIESKEEKKKEFNLELT